MITIELTSLIYTSGKITLYLFYLVGHAQIMSGWYIRIPSGGTILQHWANKGFIRYGESCNVSGMKTSEHYIDGKYALRQMCEICCLNKQSASTIIPRSRNSLTFSSWTPFRLYVSGILVPCVKTQHLCSANLSCQRSAHSMNWLRLSCMVERSDTSDNTLDIFESSANRDIMSVLMYKL